MSKNKKRIWSILLTLCMVFTMIPATAVTASAEGAPYALKLSTGTNFYANGTPITIVEEGEKTVIKYDDGYAEIADTATDGVYGVSNVDTLDKATDVSGCSIYGGDGSSSETNIDSASITMESGSVNNIYGGSSLAKSSVKSITLTIKGGTVIQRVTGTKCGANDLDIDISDNATIEGFYGAEGDVTVGDMDITISGSPSGSPTFSGDVYIGPSGTNATVTDLSCKISGGSFKGNIYGGYIGNNNNGKIQLNSDIEIGSEGDIENGNEKVFDTVEKATTGDVDVEVASGVAVTNYGTINWYGNAVNNGTIDNYGYIEGCMVNNGIINNYHTINGSYNNDEHLTNNGTINNRESGLLAETIKNEDTINNYGAYIDEDATIVGNAVTEFYPVTLSIFGTADGVVPTDADDRQDSGKGYGAYWAEEKNEYTIDLRNEEGIDYYDPYFKPDDCKLSKNINVTVDQTLLDKACYGYDRTRGILTIHEDCITEEVGIYAVLIPKTTLTVTAPTFEKVTYGYNQPAAKAITIANTGESIAYIDSIALSGQGADAFTLSGTKPETLAASTSDSTSIKLQPKAGLPAGTYTATITITYDNGKTATAEVSFTVNKKTQLESTPDPVVGDESEDKYGNYEVTETKGGKVEVAYTAPASKNKTTVTIPATTKLKDGTVAKVTSIDDKAFKNNKKIKKVTIGKNVEEIGKEAFSGATKLTTVTIGSKVEKIGNKAFYKATALKKVTVPAKTTTIGSSAFYGCKKLTTATIGKNVKSIGSKAFYGTKNLKKITIKSTKLTSAKVGKQAFKGVPAKAKVDVPNKKVKAYKKFFYKKGLNKKAKIS